MRPATTAFDSLLQLNHERYGAEAKAGLVDKMKSRSQRAKSKVADLTAQSDLIQPQEWDLFG